MYDDQATQDERVVEDEETLADPLDELDAQSSRLRSVADELRGSRGKAVLTVH